MINFTTPTLRVYFNRKEDAPKVWSLDCGIGTEEILVSEVTACGVSQRSGFRADAVPCGWFEFENVRV